MVWATNPVGSWQSGSELHTNHGDLTPVFGDTNAWEPSVYTNPVNKRELVASWHTWYDLNGDEYAEDEGVFVCRELLP